MKEIDILGSYVKSEFLFTNELKNAIKISHDGYYAPFFWQNPWTKCLRNKKVLVVHPFAEDIKNQYENHRLKIWDNPDVLPEFELIAYKAVQSIMRNKVGYATWFDALQKMKDDISKIDYDIALVGCGAYGMPLAAYCKQMGKSSIHLAGWLQVLFGIVGKRWEDNPRVAPYINEYWIRPSSSNIPIGVEKVENGCYW